MAAFSNLVARTGFTEELEKHLNRHIGVIRLDAPTSLVADDEAGALEIAIESFENNALTTDCVVNLDDVDIYEKTDANGEVLGWSVYAGSSPNSDSDEY